eukprot:GEMP01024351.1.p1 GENE.GEMP01024351.1~~GEMP01024351.1.p1  ORF type:complete len:298 (-),score=48.72 GEMP01024351.1:1373-2266(-)
MAYRQQLKKLATDSRLGCTHFQQKVKHEQMDLLLSLGQLKPEMRELGLFVSKLSDRCALEQTLRCFLCALLDMNSGPLNMEKFPSLENRCKASCIINNFPGGELTPRQLFLVHKVESFLTPNKNVVSAELQGLSTLLKKALSEEVCAICLHEFGMSVVVPRCGHAMHADCFLELSFKDVGAHGGKCRSCLQRFRWGNDIVTSNLMSMMWNVVDRTLAARNESARFSPDQKTFVRFLAERVALETGATVAQVMAEHERLKAEVELEESKRAAQEKAISRRSKRLSIGDDGLPSSAAHC